jgi:hypothetical protein
MHRSLNRVNGQRIWGGQRSNQGLGFPNLGLGCMKLERH